MENGPLIRNAARLLLPLLPACIPLLLSCAPINSGGNTSTVGNPLSGVLFEQNGGRAKNARVLVVPSNYDPRMGPSQGMVIDSTMTNETGGFHFDSLPADTYNILGSGSSGLSFRDSIAVAESAATIYTNDTLHPAGSIRGVIRLRPGDDSRSVFIIVLGTMTLGAPDDSIGNFSLGSMAGGVYRVRLLSTLGTYRPMDTLIAIQAGKDLALSDTIWLQYTGIPVPQGFQADYDSMLQVVTLTWNRPVAGRAIKGYNIFRKHRDSGQIMIKSEIPDTVFLDSTGIQGMTYEYRVAAVDTQGTEGVKSTGVSVTFSSSLVKITGTIVKGEGTAPGQFFGVARGDIDRNGNIFIFDRGNNRLQKLDSAGNHISTITGFLEPQGFAFGPENTFFVADRAVSKIYKYDSNSIALKNWSSQNKPWSLLFLSDTLYVLTDNGLEMFDTSGQKLGQKDFTLDFSYDGGDLAVDSGGNIYVSDGANVYRFDKAGDSLHALYHIQNNGYNQNPRIYCISNRFIMISTMGAASPFNSSHYLIDISGSLIGRWYSIEYISDIMINNDACLTALSTDGKILRIGINIPTQ